jgi:MerR family transcriptional regulator, light-induced transcriptional regulator
VLAMREQLATGISAAQAATMAAAADAPAPTQPLGAGAAARLDRALAQLDDAGAQAAFDELIAQHSLDGILRDLIVPYLHELGKRWQRGDVTVAQEHFASAFLRGRLLGLARGWDRGRGPRALLACAPGELHELSLIAFGLALRSRGWRITYLGPNTPLDEIERTAAEIEAAIVVIVAITSPALVEAETALTALATKRPLALAGAATGEELAHAIGARLLAADPVTEAEALTSDPSLAA